jgi:hypothetical protein
MIRIIGPSGSGQRRRSLFGVLAAFSLLLVLVVPNAFAVHDDGVFQLDGNAKQSDLTNATEPTAGTDDWDNVCAEVVGPVDANATCGTNVETDKAEAVSWVSEPDRSTSIFTGGGSKDPQDLNNWLWKNAGGLPDKDNLRHAFAAQYSGTSDLLYFGSDRFDNSGDAVQGFWFLQAPLAADGTSSQGGNLFTDGTPGGIPAHTAPDPNVPGSRGDILVISDFSNGGSVSTINIYEWVASGGDTTTHLDFVDGGTNALCDPTLSPDNFCGIVNPANQSPTASPWAFLDKSNSTSFLNGEFFEAGIDLTGLGFGNECFSTVVSETRASTSPSATLKDFVVGKFGNCSTTLVTTPTKGDGTALGPDTAPFNNLVETSIGTGTVSVRDSAELTVNGVSSFTGTLSFFICGPIASGACSTDGVAAGSSTVTTNGPYSSEAVTLTSAGRYCWLGVFDSGTANVPDASDATTESSGPPSSTGECFEVLPVPTSLDTQAVASPVNFGSAVQDTATLSGAATGPGTNGVANGGNATYPSIKADNGVIGGTITFTLTGPGACDAVPTGTGTNPQVVPVTNAIGNGTYGPVSFTPNQPGTYHWKAVYTPLVTDVNNLGSSHNAACGDADEDVVVQQVPTTTTTRQFVFPQDKVKITAAAGGNLAGSVAIRLFDTLENCQADTNGSGNDPGLLYSEGATGDLIQHAITGPSAQFATTNNTTVPVTSSTTVYWNVVYTSTNPAQTGSGSQCLESTAVTYAGNDPSIIVP